MEEEDVIDMDSLSTEERKAVLERIVSKKFLKLSGLNLLRDEISKYVNDWENATIKGLYLRRLNCLEAFSILDENQLKYGSQLTPSQLEDFSKERKMFEIQLSRIENKIKYRESKVSNIVEPVIGREYLTLIHRKYKDELNEPLDSWIERFVYPIGNPVDPIVIDKKVVPGSNRLVLIAILATIQTITLNNFVFKKFVLDRFGLKNFEKAKTDHKDKKEFIDVKKACNDILKK